ncbi:MAG: DUF4362 domain-containing protein [Erysipelotrichaceae bacterium]|nr:DUF4362 domain-containing protein [Erysipelotrichaceae bacterium]
MRNILLFIFILLMLVACKPTVNEKPVVYEGEHADLFSELPDRPEEGGDIFIVANDGLHNEEIWDAFYEQVKAGQEASLLIGAYTIEGDVIYKLLEYDGSIFSLNEDNSRDSYASIVPDRIERTNLYYLEYQSKEEVNGQEKPFMNRYCFLSDEVYDEEGLNKVFEKFKTGEESGLLMVWGYSGMIR